MTLELTPLDFASLPAAVQRICGPASPAPAKMMAARGLAPMGPRDLVCALYQLSRDADSTVARAAESTAGGLPEGILAGALSEALDARVLHFFATSCASRQTIIEKVLLNPATDDQTFVALAASQSEHALEVIAVNQQRLLRTPAIIEALYFNRHARMSTVERLLELAVRHNLTLERIPMFKEIRASILGQAAETAAAEDETAEVIEDFGTAPANDDLFAQVLGEGWDEGPVGSLEYEERGEKDEGAKRAWNQLTVNEKLRLASIGNVFHRMLAVRDPNRSVALGAIRSPGVSEQEAARYASNRSINEEIIREIATRKEFQKSYGIKVALCNNPKCPLAYSIRLIPHLRANDLKTLGRSKNVPATLSAAARAHLSKK